MRIAFAGTPDFARVALVALAAAGFDIALVLTQPDRPSGRGMKLVAAPVKALALERGWPLAQPHGLRLDGRHANDAATAQRALHAARIDALVVAAYGLILPPWLLELPRLGCINIHASLLPRWRGAAPIQRAIEAGDAATGVTVMQMDAGLDSGAMLLAEALPIRTDDSASSLQARLADLGARLIVEALQRVEAGSARAVAQPQAGVTYAHKIDKAEAAIDWRLPARTIERRLRAFDPFPGASGVLGGAALKLWRATVVDGRGVPGVVLGTGAGGVVVACGVDALQLIEVQRPGGKRLAAAQWLQAQPVQVGDRFELASPPPASA